MNFGLDLTSVLGALQMAPPTSSAISVLGALQMAPPTSSAISVLGALQMAPPTSSATWSFPPRVLLIIHWSSIVYRAAVIYLHSYHFFSNTPLTQTYNNLHTSEHPHFQHQNYFYISFAQTSNWSHSQYSWTNFTASSKEPNSNLRVHNLR